MSAPSEWGRAMLVLVATSIVRLIIAAFAPLFPDETYYWEWSRRLAFGYFDHPPLVAWLIRAGTLAFGDTAIGVRFGAVLAGITCAAIICATARRLAGDRAAFIAAVVFAVMPMSAAGLVLATPDATLLACVAAVLYAVMRAIEQPPRSRASLAWWCAAGLVQGLALWSKYTAVLVPAGIVVALLWRRELRERLREPGPYVATIVASAVFLPVIAWNASRAWVSFAFQLQHGFGEGTGSILGRELDLITGQIGLVSPILFIMMAIAISRSLRAPLSFLGVVALLVFAFFIYSATGRRPEANWPAIAYVPAVLVLVARGRSPRWDRWLTAGIALAAAFTIVTYVNVFIPVIPNSARWDPLARASGWKDLAAAIQRAPSGADTAAVVRPPFHAVRWFIAGNRYQEASELAYHLPGHPETFSLNISSRPNQYDLWPHFTRRAASGDGLRLVVDDVVGIHPTVKMLAPHFNEIHRGPLVPLTRDGDLVKNLRIWELTNWRGTWPGQPLHSHP